jgi:transposase
MLTTWRYRIKDSGSSRKILEKWASAVNFVWNFTKETQITALNRKSVKVVTKKDGSIFVAPNFLTKFELNKLVSGSSKELGIHSQTVQGVAEEYATRVFQFKKTLRWRSKRSLGWIPFKSSGIALEGDRVTYAKHVLKFWNSRNLPDDAKIKTGSFSQDSRGRWYVSVTFESSELVVKKGESVLGVDLGIKHLAALSDGTKIERPNLRERYLKKIRGIEKTRRFARRKEAKTKKYGKLPKSKQLQNLHAKVKNARDDYLHKESTKLVERSAVLIVGKLPCKFMNRNRRLSGVSLDNGIGKFKTMLGYKADRAGVTFQEISEKNSTQTCSACGWQHPAKNRIGLGVREWKCGICNSMHDRDVNAARNILRMGHHTLIQATASAGAC